MDIDGDVGENGNRGVLLRLMELIRGQEGDVNNIGRFLRQLIGAGNNNGDDDEDDEDDGDDGDDESDGENDMDAD